MAPQDIYVRFILSLGLIRSMKMHEVVYIDSKFLRLKTMHVVWRIPFSCEVVWLDFQSLLFLRTLQPIVFLNVTLLWEIANVVFALCKE